MTENYAKAHQLHPDLKNSATLSYILGVLRGDGYVYHDKKGHYSVTLNVKSLKFAKSFRRSLVKIGLKPIKIFSDGRGYYWVRAQSKEFYNWYRSLGPSASRELIDAIKGNEIDFIRGFYEAEGGISYADYGYKLRISNTDYDIVEAISKHLTSINILNYLKRYKNKNGCIYYQLGIYRDCKRFLGLVNPCFKYIIDNRIVK
ncbi:MAG: hypothetical protein KGH60_04120 [Candidatus Micrarchaeota archaeon]|nr:hypothetical protein [Candidatus Micrarchaeota archaeon]